MYLMIFLFCFVLGILCGLLLKLYLQKRARPYRCELAATVRKLLEDENAPQVLVDFGLHAIKYAFDPFFAWKAFFFYIKERKQMRFEFPKFEGVYNAAFHEILNKLGMITMLNSPFIMCITIFYLAIRQGSTNRIDQKIAFIGMKTNHAHA